MKIKKYQTLHPHFLHGADYNPDQWNDYPQILGVYGEDFYKDMPALLKNSYGRGQAYYIACRDTGAMSDALYEKRLSSLQIPTYHLPEGVSIHSREKYLFVENYNTHPVTVELPGSYRNVKTRQLYTHTVDLAPLSVAVVCKE